MFCEKCGTQLPEGANHCSNCGAPVNGRATQNFNPVSNSGEQKSRVVAGVLGILLGFCGAHNFYLGYTRNAIIQVCLTVATFITCGYFYSGIIGAVIWGLIEGIFILTGKIDTDANGVTLKD